MIPPIANRFVAGESPAAAMDHAAACNRDGIGVMLNRLGEHYGEREPADADADAYVSLLGDLEESGLDAAISVKPSQIGLEVSEAVFAANLDRIADAAADHDRFVWLDMEDHTTTDATLEAFADNVVDHPDMGLCLQANLKRTPDDLDRLAGLPGKVRLVKGAYDPPSEVAYRSKERVNEAYRDLLGKAFREWEGGVAVGSHDPAMIDHAEALHDEHGTDWEVQMLMGVREDAQRELARRHPVSQYVPYGDKWLSYFYRRVMERKENALFALRAILG